LNRHYYILRPTQSPTNGLGKIGVVLSGLICDFDLNPGLAAWAILNRPVGPQSHT